MPTKNDNETKLFCKMGNDDYQQIGEVTNMNLEIDDNNSDNNSDDKILIDKSILQEKSIFLKINKKRAKEI